MPIKYFAFDTETTGLDPHGGDQVLSLAYILLDEHMTQIASDEIFAFPTDDALVTEAAANINGYSRERWTERGAVSQEELFGQVAKVWELFALDRAYPLGQNVRFDMDFLVARGKLDGSFKDALQKALGYHLLDTLVLSVSLDIAHTVPNARHRLTDMAERWGVPLTQAHDAKADLEATVGLYRAFIKHLRTTAPPPPPVLARFLEKHGEDYVFQMGKHRGVRLADVDKSYLHWALNKAQLRDEERALFSAQLGLIAPPAL